MTIWRQKKVSSKANAERDLFETFVSDPFEFNDDFGFNESLPQEKSTPVKRKAEKSAKNQLSVELPTSDRGFDLRRYVLYPCIALGLIVLTFALVKMRPWSYWGASDAVYAYFEVRAVDHSGRPVAGALVKNAGKKVGTTDSFGEWRRYMRVPLGGTIPITLTKKSANELLFATKNFAVPLQKPEKIDLELRASVQLIPSGSKVAVESLADNPTDTSNTAAATTMTSHNLSTIPNRDSVGDTTDSTRVEQTDQKVDESPQKVGKKFVSSHESIWFEATGSQSAPLSKEILPAMQQRAKELGLKVDSRAEWKVRLTGLIDRPSVVSGDGGGLIMVTSFDSQSRAPREFLRNYQADPRQTARGILYVLSRHINKNIAAMEIGSQWVAVLPKVSSEFWRLAGDMSMIDRQGKVWLTSQSRFENSEFGGYLLSNSSKGDTPCSAGVAMCEFTTRSFQEIPPVPSWKRLRLKVSAKTRDALKIFASGYEAKQVADGVFEYWGQDGAKINVTVVEAGRLLQRVQIQSDSKLTPVLALSGASISKR